MSENNQLEYSCSVSVTPDRVVTRNFSIEDNPEIALCVFRQKLRKLEAEKRGTKAKTDRFLTECDKKIHLVERAIHRATALIERDLPLTHASTSYPRKEKRQWKALRRKVTRPERERTKRLR
jgi:hypothetical protein